MNNRHRLIDKTYRKISEPVYGDYLIPGEILDSVRAACKKVKEKAPHCLYESLLKIGISAMYAKKNFEGLRNSMGVLREEKRTELAKIIGEEHADLIWHEIKAEANLYTVDVEIRRMHNIIRLAAKGFSHAVLYELAANRAEDAACAMLE